MTNIINLKLLKKNGLIIMHRHKKENEIYPEELKIFKIKTYGISKIIFGLVNAPGQNKLNAIKELESIVINSIF